MPPSNRDEVPGQPAEPICSENVRRMADIVPAMIWMTDANHQCCYLNRDWLQFTGQTLEQGLGAGVMAAFHPDDHQSVEREYREAAQRLEPFAVEYRLRRADGTYHWVVGEGRPVLDDQGRWLGYVGCVVDIQAQKATEEALRQSQDRLRQLNDTLELQVLERTRQLSERESRLASLARQLTKAEQNERTRLAQVLHDQVQQLLVAAKMRISLGAMEASSDVVAELDEAQKIIDQAIEAVRTLSAEMCPPVLHVRGLGAGLEWLAAKMDRHHGLTVDLETDPAADTSDQALRDLLFQAARELLLNVVKHAQTAQCQVRLSRDQGRIVLEVIDQGRGFDEQAMTAASQHSIGLFHIRERLRYVGGELTLDTAPGRGTHATIKV